MTIYQLEPWLREKKLLLDNLTLQWIFNFQKEYGIDMIYFK